VGTRRFFLNVDMGHAIFCQGYAMDTGLGKHPERTPKHLLALLYMGAFYKDLRRAIMCHSVCTSQACSAATTTDRVKAATTSRHRMTHEVPCINVICTRYRNLTGLYVLHWPYK